MLIFFFHLEKERGLNIRKHRDFFVNMPRRVCGQKQSVVYY
jgi:hypothetical protein